MVLYGHAYINGLGTQAIIIRITDGVLFFGIYGGFKVWLHILKKAKQWLLTNISDEFRLQIKNHDLPSGALRR